MYISIRGPYLGKDAVLLYEKWRTAKALADIFALATGAHPLAFDGVGRLESTRRSVVAQTEIPAGQRHVEVRHFRLTQARCRHFAPAGDGCPFADDQIGACLLQTDRLGGHCRTRVGITKQAKENK